MGDYMKSPIQALMEEYKAPMTRDAYLQFTNLGKNTQPSAEEESEMPAKFAYPVVTHEELPEPKAPLA
jgi:hypothetical protein